MILIFLSSRFNDFCATLKFSDNKNSTIVVGHSLFIKDFCVRYLSPEIIESKKTLANSLQNMRLSNAGCLYARVDLSDHLNPKIIDVDILFETTFVK